MGTILPHCNPQNRQTARVDKNDPIAFLCGGWGPFFPTAKAQNRQAARVDKNDPLACPCGDGLSVLSLPQKVQSLRKNISRKKRTPSHKNKPKTAAPGGAGFSGQPAGRRPGGAAAAANEVRRPAFGGQPAARIPVAAGTFPPSRANLCKTITISFYRKGGLAP